MNNLHSSTRWLSRNAQFESVIGKEYATVLLHCCIHYVLACARVAKNWRDMSSSSKKTTVGIAKRVQNNQGCTKKTAATFTNLSFKWELRVKRWGSSRSPQKKEKRKAMARQEYPQMQAQKRWLAREEKPLRVAMCTVVQIRNSYDPLSSCSWFLAFLVPDGILQLYLDPWAWFGRFRQSC